MRKNKGKILLTTLIILLPIIFGLLFWGQLPDRMATHFGVDSEADGWNSKPFAVFGIPLLLAALHLLCLAGTFADPKRKNIGEKPLNLVFWIIPGLSLVINALLYANALGKQVNVGFALSLFLGILFIVLGNLLPKSRQNYSFGFKLPWTLNDPENWRRTHRLAGFCTVIAGVVIAATAFLCSPWILFAVMIPALLVPIVYSYLYHVRHSTDD